MTNIASYRTLTATGIGLGIALTGAIAAIALFESEGGVGLEPGYFGTLPVVALAALPAVLAAIGLKRPSALLAGGILSLPAAFLSFAGATLPLLIPAAFYLVAYGRAPASHPRVPVALAAATLTVMAVAALFVSFGGQRTVCRETRVYEGGRRDVRETESHGSGVLFGGGSDDEDVISVESSCSSEPSPQASAASLILIASAVLTAVWMSKPSDRHSSRAPAGSGGYSRGARP